MNERLGVSSPPTQSAYGWPSLVVARQEGIYCCFPDLVRTRSGRLICVFRESDSHSAREFSHLALTSSQNDGQSWTPPIRLVESTVQEGTLFKWNCPRIGQLPDGRLWLLCDGYPVPPGERETWESRVFLWFSEDEGTTWVGPGETPIRGIVPDRLLVTRGGAWLIATHYLRRETGTLGQSVWRSEDAGATWTEHRVCVDRRFHACEASIVSLPDGLLVAYMRENSGLGLPALKAFSRDDGRTWEGPALTLIAGCHRPVAGVVGAERILVTYRWLLGGRSANRHFYGFLEMFASAAAPSQHDQQGIVFPIDRDDALRPDTGYSGWVPLSDGRLFCVNYIVDDHSSAQIRGYWIDWHLLPNP